MRIHTESSKEAYGRGWAVRGGKKCNTATIKCKGPFLCYEPLKQAAPDAQCAEEHGDGAFVLFEKQNLSATTEKTMRHADVSHVKLRAQETKRTFDVIMLSLPNA